MFLEAKSDLFHIFGAMSAKWYISTLFLIFTYFGIFHEQVSVPNQEIVLEFVDTEVNQQGIENTINDVREKLLEIGVSNIKIQETKDGTLKISYYSDAHINNIKEALLDENQLVVDQNSEDQENNQSSVEYKIDVYEITDQNDISKRNNKLVFENKYHSDRFTNDHNYSSIKSVKASRGNQNFKTSYRAYKNNPFVKDYTSHKDPEVRAGPLT